MLLRARLSEYNRFFLCLVFFFSLGITNCPFWGVSFYLLCATHPQTLPSLRRCSVRFFLSLDNGSRPAPWLSFGNFPWSCPENPFSSLLCYIMLIPCLFTVFYLFLRCWRLNLVHARQAPYRWPAPSPSFTVLRPRALPLTSSVLLMRSWMLLVHFSFCSL